MDISADDQFKRLRAQILATQELLYSYNTYLTRNPRDLHTLGIYDEAIKRHQSLRDEVDILLPPPGK